MTATTTSTNRVKKFELKDETVASSYIQSIAKSLRAAKRCVVVTGAGISVSAGIPVRPHFFLFI